jgi:protein-tyrosine phosphatase
MAAPNLYFGRRLTPGEARQAQALGWQSVLDLAAEFSEVAALRAVPRYRSLPVLDGTAPTGEQLREAVAWIVEAVERGPVYVHCALGHGRTATIVLAYLLTTAEVATVREGLTRLRALRSGVGLHRQQAELVRGLERSNDVT